jgi:hypothetical protein
VIYFRKKTKRQKKKEARTHTHTHSATMILQTPHSSAAEQQRKTTVSSIINNRMTVGKRKTNHYSLFLLLLASSVWLCRAWRQCPDTEGGGICPDSDTCCPTAISGVSACITAKKNEFDLGEFGTCCNDKFGEVTGCGVDYQCVTVGKNSNNTNTNTNTDNNNNNKKNEPTVDYACRLREDTPDKPQQVPRYQLCQLEDAGIFKEIHGFPIAPATAHKPLFLAYYSTIGSLTTNDPAVLTRHAPIETLLIIIHGSERNADDYLCCGVSALTHPYDISNTLVIAPFFVAPKDGPINVTTTRSATAENKYDQQVPKHDVLSWNEHGPIPHTWRYGADAKNAPISSYATIDAIVDHVSRATVQFPNMKHIVVAGHSAGGQFVQRWALLSNSPAWGGEDSDASDNNHNNMLRRTSSRSVSIRVVAANPRSYCYLDARRMVNGTLKIPDQADIDQCDMYNQWQWGLDDGSELIAPYKDRAIQEVGGDIEVLAERYAKRNIVYLSGELDVLYQKDLCVTSVFQGANRQERAMHFWEALRQKFDRQIHQLHIADGSPHDHCLMFQSPQGREALFGNL